MTMIVPVVEGGRGQPRIIPKVFADIPSQRELDDAKRSRNGLALWVLLLAGALIAAVAFIVYLTVLQRPPPPDNTLVTRMEAAEKARDEALGQVTAKQKELTDLQSLVGSFRGIAEAQRQFGQLQADIRAAISPPSLPDAERQAREADVRNRLRLLRTEWATFDEGAKWAGTSKDQVQAGFENQVNTLITLKQRIDGLGLPPPPAAPCNDPAGCR